MRARFEYAELQCWQNTILGFAFLFRHFFDNNLECESDIFGFGIEFGMVAQSSSDNKGENKMAKRKLTNKSRFVRCIYLLLFEKTSDIQFCNDHTAIYRTHVLKVTSQHIPAHWLREKRRFVFDSFRFVYITELHTMPFKKKLSSERFQCIKRKTMRSNYQVSL